MPYWIQVDILQDLINRLRLSDTKQKADQLLLSPFVQPVTAADSSFSSPAINPSFGSNTASFAGTGHKPLFTVPSNKKWILYGFSVLRQTGNLTISDLYVFDGSSYLYLVLLAGAGHQLVNLNGLALKQGWVLGMTVDTVAAATLVDASIIYEEIAA